MATGQRLLVKITRESLPQVKDKYPFIYLERGRLEVDDSSVKWIDADNHVVPLPVATLNALLLGPGTTITTTATITITTPRRAGVAGCSPPTTRTSARCTCGLPSPCFCWVVRSRW